MLYSIGMEDGKKKTGFNKEMEMKYDRPFQRFPVIDRYDGEHDFSHMEKKDKIDNDFVEGRLGVGVKKIQKKAKAKNGSLYLIEMEDKFYNRSGRVVVKIGVTSKSLKKRLQELQGSCPHMLNIYRTKIININDLYNIEWFMHFVFESKATTPNNEWFIFNDRDLRVFNAVLAKIDVFKGFYSRKIKCRGTNCGKVLCGVLLRVFGDR